jgi:catechol 2,3-dioxygenase-like lactoylglutathione lyase family enzyme
VTTPSLRLAATTLSSPNANALARFYQRLLGWDTVEESDGWVTLRAPGGGAGLSFHQEDDYVRPVWPTAPGEQLMMAHLDIAVDDVEAGAAFAVEVGATAAGHQPQSDVRVMLDPDGHPFCLYRG